MRMKDLIPCKCRAQRRRDQCSTCSKPTVVHHPPSLPIYTNTLLHRKPRKSEPHSPPIQDMPQQASANSNPHTLPPQVPTEHQEMKKTTHDNQDFSHPPP
ncbi:unnamed protein product [Periconia digitata]|uniref:Uncharacterized protein n=1 Tax=Periconia digitata TaxID=1303443 RepID=A0A9W4UFX7_9PLEO|nr:unnamed protein product [Periconia digitata]